jgi:hypothetical protein
VLPHYLLHWFNGSLDRLKAAVLKGLRQ